MHYRLNEAVGRPFDWTVNGARMIGSGVFDRHPNLQVLIVHMGGELASILGRLEFTWRLNYNGVRNPPDGRPYKNQRPPSDYFKTNILVDTMEFNPIGVRAAIEMCGADRVMFGSDYGPVPYGIEEHIRIVEDVLPGSVERQQVFWKTSNRVFRLGLSDTDLITLLCAPEPTWRGRARTFGPSIQGARLALDRCARATAGTNSPTGSGLF
jgi:predicted TIM-barrel fold metal-dependent hydrolase